MTRMPKSPWPAQVIRDQAAHMMEKVGGKTGFEAIGPTFRGAMVDQAVMAMFQTATMPGPITVTADDINNTRRAIRFACGMGDE